MLMRRLSGFCPTIDTDTGVNPLGMMEKISHYLL